MERKSYKYLPILCGLYTGCLLLCNFIASKIIVLGPLYLSAATLFFPITYLFDDILTEVYGYAQSRIVIWTGVVAQLLMIVVTTLAVSMPPAPFWPHQDAYAQILSATPRIALASLSALFFGEFCNSYVLAKMKVKTQGKGLGTRFVLSTAAGEAVDSLIFFTLAFWGTMQSNELLWLIFCAWSVKVVWEIVALPATIPVVRAIKRIEHEDYFDLNTDFNPFRLTGRETR